MSDLERAQRAIDALRKPDASLATVVNTVRQSIAEAIEGLLPAAQGSPDRDEVRKPWRELSPDEIHNIGFRLGWNDALESAIDELQSIYPDHAWLNAACAAIRSLSDPVPAGDKGEAVAWQKRADEMIMSLGCIKLGVIDQIELRAAFLKLMTWAAAPQPAGNAYCSGNCGAFDLIRLGARAMRRAAEADCGNHSESVQEDAMTSGGLTRADKMKLSAEADAADEIRKQISETCEDSALGYLSYMGSEEDIAALKALGVTSDWLYRRENGVPSRAEIAKATPSVPSTEGK